ncbi:hypothetical protein DUNSADRAFT_9645, partial [Dunaliella salina]
MAPTCGTQAVLRELQLVLALMCPSVSQHMNGELRDEWLRAREGMLLHRKAPAPALKTQVSDRQGRLPPVRVHAARQGDADPWIFGTPYSGPLPVSPASPLGNTGRIHSPSPKPYKRSSTQYSRAQEMPQ